LIKDRIFIDNRPEVINNKLRYGDWEIDTIIGKGNKGAIVTVVERKSAFLLMAKLNGKKPRDLAKAVVRLLAPYKEKVLSITADNGSEFAYHKYISQKLKTDFYFAHPYSSWERGLNEYTNKLIRQYIPKKTDFNDYNEQYIFEVNMKINSRPRKNLGFKTPIKVLLDNFDKKVALAG
jgi:IS30 family transposase